MNSLFAHAADWISVPVTAVIGALGFHYRKVVSEVKELDSRVDKLQVEQAVISTDLHYIKKSCDQITEKLEKIEEKLNRTRASSNQG